MKPLCRVIGTLLLSVLLPWPSTGQFHVIGPSTPVVALVGKEAVLSCHLNPVKDAQNMEVMWHRNHPSGLVHHYGASWDHMEQQIPEYQGRTEFLKENITKGQAALRIYPIRPSDAGKYSCSFESSTYNSGAQFIVMVTVSGIIPRVFIEPGNTNDIKLTCTSTGWYPKPKVQWRDHQGLFLSSDSETNTVDGNGLFSVETSITVDKNSGETVSCLIRNPILSEEKEVRISVADAFFPGNNPWIVCVFLLLFLLLVAATFGAVYVMRTRKNKGFLKWQSDFLQEFYESVCEKHDAVAWEYRFQRKKYSRLKEIYDYLMKEKVLSIRLQKSGTDEISKFLDPGNAQGMEDLNKARKFAEDIILDGDTAHPYLQVSDDGKSVISLIEKKTFYRDYPERFDTLEAVLGKSSFSSGDHYWEVCVTVARTDSWMLGLCVDSVPRNAKDLSVSPENGFWTLDMTAGKYSALSSPPFSLNLPVPPLKVGVFLQYEKGLISFYNVTDRTILYTFKSNFTQPLKPYFSLRKGNFIGLTILEKKQTLCLIPRP